MSEKKDSVKHLNDEKETNNKVYKIDIYLNAYNQMQQKTNYYKGEYDEGKFFNFMNKNKFDFKDIDIYNEIYKTFAGNNVMVRHNDKLLTLKERWGGAPEQWALSKYFKMPVVVYHLQKYNKHTTTNTSTPHFQAYALLRQQAGAGQRNNSNHPCQAAQWLSRCRIRWHRQSQQRRQTFTGA